MRNWIYLPKLNLNSHVWLVATILINTHPDLVLYLLQGSSAITVNSKQSCPALPELRPSTVNWAFLQDVLCTGGSQVKLCFDFGALSLSSPFRCYHHHSPCQPGLQSCHSLHPLPHMKPQANYWICFLVCKMRITPLNLQRGQRNKQIKFKWVKSLPSTIPGTQQIFRNRLFLLLCFTPRIPHSFDNNDNHLLSTF